MSAKTLMVNEGMLQEIEKRVAEIRSKGGDLVRAMLGKATFGEGVAMANDYTMAVEVLQEVGKQLFGAMDLVDPEDNELLSREEDEEEEEGEGEGDDEDEDDGEGDDDEDDEEDPA